MARRSTDSLGSSVGAPCTWQRKPSSAYLSARTMPDLASRSDASTSCVLLPMDETIPIPVTTTRLMAVFPSPRCGKTARLRSRCGCRQRRVFAEQPDLEVERAIDNRAIGGQPAVGNPQHQLRTHHALH